jgi:hypothetical protein
MKKLLVDSGFRIGYGLMLIGVILLLVGFAVDAWLHSDDPTLAEREGVFTLSNPGHLLVAIGLAVTIAGACVGPYARWLLPSKSALVSTGAPALVAMVALAGSFGFANAVGSAGHDDTAHPHDDAATAPVPGETHSPASAGEAASGHAGNSFILGRNTGTVALSESTMHMPENTQPVGEENLRFAEQFLADVREQTAKYKDVNVAIADGYVRITPDIPLIGAHFFHAGYDGLDPAHPSILLYQEDGAGGWELVGVSFGVEKTLGDDTPPDSPLGGMAGWHYHTDLCFLFGGTVTIARSQADCDGGLFVAETSWLLHVWAWKDSPEGVFDHANSLVQRAQ